MKITNHLLDDPKVDTSTQSPNKGGTINPTVIVLHYTASGGEDGKGDAEYLSRASSRASAHVVVGRNGSIDQIIPFNKKAWHAGRSSYKGKSNVNGFSIGIEIDNWGWLDHGGKSHAGVKIPDNFIFEGERSGHKYWESYREEQLAAVEEVIAAIVANYNITDIVGHEDVSPGRKQDPGPALDVFKSEMQSKYLNETKPTPTPTPKPSRQGAKKVTVNGLRLRQRPSTSSVILTHLQKNTEVIEIRKDVYPGWSQIRVGTKVGYVANCYLTD